MKVNVYLSEKIKILSFFQTALIVILHSNMAMLCTGSVSFIQQAITAEVARIAVPLFLMISGFLFFINYNGILNDYKRKLRERTRSLLIPYVLFLLCGSIAMFLIGRVYTVEAFISIIKKGLFLTPPVFYPLWFLRDLYIMVLFSPLVYWVVKKVQLLLIIPIIVWALGKNPFVFPCAEAILFFCIGAFLTTKVNILEKTMHKGTLPTLLLWLFLCFLNTYISKYVTPMPYITHCMIILLGVYAIWILYDKLYPKFSEHVKNSKIYKYTFFIYLLHEPILTIIKKTGLFLFGDSSLAVGSIYFIAPILTILAVYGIGLVLNTYSPRLLALITGGRATRK